MIGYFKNIKLKILGVVFLLGFIYIVLPSPTKIEDFPPISPSLKSNLEGDTIQNPNIAAYYSNFQRQEITDFYKDKFDKLHWFGYIFPPFVLNHPPEYAYQFIRDQQESTFLEEYYYPLHGSFFVNGYEPRIENQIFKKASNFLGNHIIYNPGPGGPELYFDSKITVRYYPNNVFFRILIYLGIWAAAVLVYKLFCKSLKEG